MTTLRRTQLRLEPEQHRALSEIAKREGRSISDVVREIVRQHLKEQEKAAQREQALEALEELTRMRKQIEARHGILPGNPVAEARAERERDIERVLRGEA